MVVQPDCILLSVTATATQAIIATLHRHQENSMSVDTHRFTAQLDPLHQLQ